MQTISVRELKAHWSEVERRVRGGETFEVLNRGNPAACIVPPRPRKVLKWDDHMATAVPAVGKSVEDTIKAERGGRW